MNYQYNFFLISKSIEIIIKREFICDVGFCKKTFVKKLENIKLKLIIFNAGKLCHGPNQLISCSFLDLLFCQDL